MPLPTAQIPVFMVLYPQTLRHVAIKGPKTWQFYHQILPPFKLYTNIVVAYIAHVPRFNQPSPLPGLAPRLLPDVLPASTGSVFSL